MLRFDVDRTEEGEFLRRSENTADRGIQHYLEAKVLCAVRVASKRQGGTGREGVIGRTGRRLRLWGGTREEGAIWGGSWAKRKGKDTWQRPGPSK